MEKRLLFKDILSKRTLRLRVCFVIYDNVGQRTLLAITMDQLKCTPRARYSMLAITAMQGALHFLTRNMSLECRISSSWSTREYINSSIRVMQDDVNNFSKILHFIYYDYIAEIIELFFTKFERWKEWSSLSADKKNLNVIKNWNEIFIFRELIETKLWKT